MIPMPKLLDRCNKISIISCIDLIEVAEQYKNYKDQLISINWDERQKRYQVYLWVYGDHEKEQRSKNE